MRHSQEYLQHLKNGPFPNIVDPWAEIATYFHQIHGEGIGAIIRQIQDDLILMGYQAGRETSLQILSNRQPDIYIHRDTRPVQPTNTGSWSYAQAAADILAEPGYSLGNEDPELDAVFVYETKTGQLVTIIELVSPANKDTLDEIFQYQNRRAKLVDEKAVNVVEIDLTRSVKRLMKGDIITAHAYHTAIFMPRQQPRIVPTDFGEALKRIAIPLCEEVIAVELQDAYTTAYQEMAIAGHIYRDNKYNEGDIPFSSLLTLHNAMKHSLPSLLGKNGWPNWNSTLKG